MDEQKFSIKRFILIILFAIILGFVVSDALRLVIQKFLHITDEQMGIALWGNTFLLRIFASLIGTAAGAFVVGTFLKTKTKLAAVITTLPVSIFWLSLLIFVVIPKYELDPANIKIFLLSIILIIASPVLGYFSATWGQKYLDEFHRPKSVLNIKWYHWLWILPFYLNKIIAVSLFTLILLWSIDANSKMGLHDNPVFSLVFNFKNIISRIIVFFVFAGLIISISHAYKLLTSEKIDWKNGVIIFGHVLLLSVLYVLIFVL